MNRNRKPWVSILAGVMAVVMLLSLIVSLIPTRANAASSSEIKKQLEALKEEKADIQAQIDEIQSQYDANSEEITDLVAQKDAIDQEIGLLHEQVTNINEQLAAYNQLIADKQDELDAAEYHLSELNAKNKERIRAMEEEGKLSYWSIIFKANDFSDLMDRINMIQEINDADQRRLAEMSVAAENVAAAQEELETEKADLESARDELDATQLELDEKRALADQLLTELIAKGQEFEAMIDESEELQDELMQEIAQAEKDLKEAQYQEWLATYVPPTTKPTGTDTTPSNQAPSSSGWVSPVKSYTLTSPFGMRMHPIQKVWKMHNGVDMAAPQGTPIYAAKAGKVTTTSYQAGGAGYYVSINHGDGFSSIYMHMTHYIVSPGQYVSAGQVIGYVGSTGGSTGPHLHFGISYNGTYVNPMNYV
ncbi:MAG: peptidoglycan DD-metalloendopeptidase family protein [Oscillospiraceae bacterium]|nr:peptidoglycan DD-metalloendopeptidase family protein [Oscillospiraceae bacterium]